VLTGSNRRHSPC